ncbi:hypothetical protein [Methylobacterium sp. Leaf108]|uniref:hypothetical protein n=1 Tax=Methylobacterium sp. Leaf108 TaxID=1736256 RepID=UPI000A8CA619|nr:hypothetical protein [Methylobacterium sp. Leaf108]
MEVDQHQDEQAKAPKKARKIKGAAPTAQEILEKARREARPTTPAERVKIEAAGQCLMPGHLELPVMKAPVSRFCAS